MRPEGAPGTARQRAREELTAAIKEEARVQLAAEGASALSLRAVARALGMVSSAVYRYFPSRDDLLTALIVDAYDAVGAMAEAADHAAGPAPEARWMAVCRSIRAWARAHPHEYALVYGSPVPGYRAPETTIAPATRVTQVLIGIVRDATGGRTLAPVDPRPVPAALADQLRSVAETVMPELSPAEILRAVTAWTQVFGLISFELFGHLVGSVDSGYDEFFDYAIAETARFIAIVPPGSGRSARSSTSHARAAPTGR